MGWLPMKYPKDSVPDEVKSRYNEKANFGGVAIDCEGEVSLLVAGRFQDKCGSKCEWI